MMKANMSIKKILFCFLLSVLALIGCARDRDILNANQSTETKASNDVIQIEEPVIEEIPQREEITDETQGEIIEPIITEMDWSNYFEEINGAAVIYDKKENCYQIYNKELALTRRPPCSTFKIISSLIALEYGIIDPDNSTRIWSGETFWNENWNRDIDFYDAFQTSCVWYFRRTIDEIGKDMMQDELNKLQYGNCDISDWSGELNTNNSNPSLTGFWIESSLLISPKEQTEVIERIFGDNSSYSEETRKRLEQVMLLSEPDDSNILIYGKTGMGKNYGVVADSWFTGFADYHEKRLYFCVYLGQTDNKEVSSAKAREIAIKIVTDYLT